MSKKEVKIISGIVLFFFIAMIALASLNKAPPKDLNVYLNEEVRFADEIFIKVVGLSVEENSEFDNDNEEGDLLSEYTLNIIASITQRNTDLWVNRVTMKSEMFTLKSVNLKAKSKNAVFFHL